MLMPHSHQLNSKRPGTAVGEKVKKLARAKKSVIKVSRVVVLGRERVAAFSLPSPLFHLLCSLIFLCCFIPVFAFFPSVEPAPRLGL